METSPSTNPANLSAAPSHQLTQPLASASDRSKCVFSPHRTVATCQTHTSCQSGCNDITSTRATDIAARAVLPGSADTTILASSSSGSYIPLKGTQNNDIPESSLPNELQACIQEWQEISTKYPRNLMFNELIKFMTKCRRALILRSIQMGRFDKENPAHIAEAFLSGTLNMATRRVSNIPEHILIPELFPPDKTNVLIMFSEHNTYKLSSIFGHKRGIITETISHRNVTFFIPDDPFRTYRTTADFIGALLSTICTFYDHPATSKRVQAQTESAVADSISNSPTETDSTCPDTSDDNCDIAILFKTLGLWKSQDKTLVIPCIKTQSGHIPPFKLITSFSKSLPESHPYHALFKRPKLNPAGLTYCPRTKEVQSDNLEKFQNRTLKSLLNSLSEQSARSSKPKEHQSSASAQPSPTVVHASSYKLENPSEKTLSLAKKIALLIQRNDTASLKTLLEHNPQYATELKDSQNNKLQKYLSKCQDIQAKGDDTDVGKHDDYLTSQD
ncbi:hypothetical protein ACTL6P_05595 [Endozoicomonas acroporae]|uniref:hypothetical protein n=1 Tax=Endozoicomonas acroporae TaxID=1701104 RepID=UPI0011AEFE9A|nr:hypothetical protein [Endozoicomonas acroporae]